MKKRRATIDHVAEKAGVSIKTVSRVLNGAHVGEKTREKVIKAATRLKYSPNLAARRLAANRSFVIGLLYDTPQSDYVTSIQIGSLGVCRRERYDLLIHPCSTVAPGLIEEIGRLLHTVDGFLLTPPVSDYLPLLVSLKKEEMKFVRVSQRPELSDAPCISVDDERAAGEITELLIALGHRRIGFIMGNPEHGASHDRLRGFQEALAAHRIAPDASTIAQGMFTFESGYEAARSLLGVGRRPTAIFASNDHMAMGVLRAAHELDLNIPDDLAVSGFDDTPMASFAWPPLTTVRQPIQEVASLATEILLALLRGETVSGEHRLRSQLVCRQSTGTLDESTSPLSERESDNDRPVSHSN
jgi:LacI family transcriptional regulator